MFEIIRRCRGWRICGNSIVGGGGGVEYDEITWSRRHGNVSRSPLVAAAAEVNQVKGTADASGPTPSHVLNC